MRYKQTYDCSDSNIFKLIGHNTRDIGLTCLILFYQMIEKMFNEFGRSVSFK